MIITGVAISVAAVLVVGLLVARKVDGDSTNFLVAGRSLMLPLSAAGLIITREDGRRRVNSLNPVPIRQIYERWMGPFAELWSSTLLRIKDDAEDRQKHDR